MSKTGEDSHILRFQNGYVLLEGTTCLSQYVQMTDHIKPPGNSSPVGASSERLFTKTRLGGYFFFPGSPG